jgi:hypothetical protein
MFATLGRVRETVNIAVTSGRYGAIQKTFEATVNGCLITLPVVQLFEATPDNSVLERLSGYYSTYAFSSQFNCNVPPKDPPASDAIVRSLINT